MKDLVEYIVTRIVNHPEDVSIEESQEEEGIIRFHIRVHPEDAGLVIGKEGKVINSIRNLVKIQAIKQHVHVYLDIVNEKKEETGE